MGARGHAEVPLSNISGVETGAWDKADAGEALLVLYGKANVRLSFLKPNTYEPMLGAETQIFTLFTQVDDPEAFKRALCEARRREPRVL